MGRIKQIYIDLINQYGHVDDIPLDVEIGDYIAKKRENEEEREEKRDQ
jgi:hypothetical protein